MKEVNDLLITCGLPAWIQHDRYSAQGDIPPQKALPSPILTTPFGEDGSSNKCLSCLFTLFVVAYWICLNLEDEVCRKGILHMQTIAVFALKIIKHIFRIHFLISIDVKYTWNKSLFSIILTRTRLTISPKYILLTIFSKVCFVGLSVFSSNCRSHLK